MNRLLRHLLFPDWLTRRRFPGSTLQRIEAAVAASERGHTGELRFAVEGALHPAQLMAGMTARERALEVFSSLRIWDTAANNGVLIYLLLAEHAIEIVADRGLARRVPAERWQAIVAGMREQFRAGQYEAGLGAAIDAVDALLTQHFPLAVGAIDTDELSNVPLVI